MAEVRPDYIAAIALAIGAQLFISPIPEVSTIKVLLTYLFANLTLSFHLLKSSHSLASTSIKSLTLNATFLFIFTTLTIIRRLYLSPLSKYPGPKFAAITKLWEVNEARHGRAGPTKKKLHRQYGDFIRTGPNEISVNHVDALDKVYAGKYTRGTFYEVGAINGAFNLNTTRDYTKHTPWRRIWEKAFVSAEFKDYNLRVEHHIGKFMNILKRGAKKEVNFRDIVDNAVFDIMADLCFSKDTGMQDGVGDASYMEFVHKYMSVGNMLGSLRNVSQLILYLPESSEVKTYRLKGEAMLAERQKLGSTKRDIFRHLLAEDSETGSKFTQEELNSNANLIIIAGTDTTASVTGQLFRFLAKNPKVVKKLQNEVDEVFAAGKELNIETTRNLPYVSAVINEALRIASPLPSGVQACTPAAGLEIAGVYLPGNIQVQIPLMALMTDERYFAQADEFIPERWTDRPELVKDRRAFSPFGHGVHSCIGKQLALNEMRLMVTSVVGYFDIELGDSYDDEVFEREWMDFMTVRLGEEYLKFIDRKK